MYNPRMLVDKGGPLGEWDLQVLVHRYAKFKYALDRQHRSCSAPLTTKHTPTL
jgi:hypothetical protein